MFEPPLEGSRTQLLKTPARANNAAAFAPDLAKWPGGDSTAVAHDLVWLDQSKAFLFAKGRVALFALLKAMGIGARDEVLVPGYTCVVVPAAVCYTGARPVYYDIEPTTFCGDSDKAIAGMSQNTRAVVVQHTYGMPSEDAELIAYCRERGIYVIEDCAHAMGGTLGGNPLGTLGDAAFASFQWTKPVPLGLGGVARVNDDSLLPAMQRFYDAMFSNPSFGKELSVMFLTWAYRHFMKPKLYWSARATYQMLGREGIVAPSSTSREITEPDVMPVGYCERFGRLRKGQLRRAMKQLPDALAHRRTITAFYDEWFLDRGIKNQKPTSNSTPFYLRYPFRVQDRAGLLGAARRARIEMGDWFNAPLHPDIDHAPALSYTKGSCPNAERLARHIANLPTHERVGLTEAQRILAFLDDHRDLLLR